MTIPMILFVLADIYYNYALSRNESLVFIFVIIILIVFYTFVINYIFYFKPIPFSSSEYLKDKQIKLSRKIPRSLISVKKAKKIMIYLIAILAFDILFFITPIMADQATEEAKSSGIIVGGILIFLPLLVIVLGFFVYRIFEYFTVRKVFQKD